MSTSLLFESKFVSVRIGVFCKCYIYSIYKRKVQNGFLSTLQISNLSVGFPLRVETVYNFTL